MKQFRISSSRAQWKCPTIESKWQDSGYKTSALKHYTTYKYTFWCCSFSGRICIILSKKKHGRSLQQSIPFSPKKLSFKKVFFKGSGFRQISTQEKAAYKLDLANYIHQKFIIHRIKNAVGAALRQIRWQIQ